MSKAARIAELRKVPIFSLLTTKDLGLILDLAQNRTYRPGATVIKEGAAGYEFFIIQAGAATVSKNGKVVSSMRPGDFFGELALLNKAPRTATVSAKSELQVLVLSRWAFLGLLGRMPDMAMKIMRAGARRLRVDAGPLE